MLNNTRIQTSKCYLRVIWGVLLNNTWIQTGPSFLRVKRVEGIHRKYGRLLWAPEAVSSADPPSPVRGKIRSVGLKRRSCRWDFVYPFCRKRFRLSVLSIKIWSIFSHGWVVDHAPWLWFTGTDTSSLQCWILGAPVLYPKGIGIRFPASWFG